MTGPKNIPITDAQARAAEATAKAAREAIQLLSGLGSYLARVFGTVPEDLVGYLGGDRLKVARAENIVRIMERSKELNDQRGVTPGADHHIIGAPAVGRGRR